jgi:hypothetical protein
VLFGANPAAKRAFRFKKDVGGGTKVFASFMLAGQTINSPFLFSILPLNGICCAKPDMFIQMAKHNKYIFFIILLDFL